MVVLEGNISVGKSTLTRRLAEHLESLGFVVMKVMEWKDDGVLEHFYEDMEANALETETVMLGHRAIDYKRGCRWLETVVLQEGQRGAVLLCDRWPGSSVVFASQTIEDEQHYANFDRVWQDIVSGLRAPDVMIYLRAPPDVVSDRVKRRMVENGRASLADSDRDNRDMEEAIDTSYLFHLHERYEAYNEMAVQHWSKTHCLTFEWADFGETEAVAEVILQE